MEIHYVIGWYDKETNILLGEIEANLIPLTVWQQLFTLSANGVFLYDSHLIEQHHVQALLPWIPFSFDFNHYIYQLDCFTKVATSIRPTPFG